MPREILLNFIIKKKFFKSLSKKTINLEKSELLTCKTRPAF